MLVPSRVKIIKNRETEYYNQFIGQEYDVLYYHQGEVSLQIKDETGICDVTTWWGDEYEVLDTKEEVEELEVEMVTISKTEYDELLEFKELWNERIVFDYMYKDKEVKDI